MAGEPAAELVARALDNLHAMLMSHQQASARDRHAMLEKIDRLDEKFDAKFDDLARRVVDVCDRGRGEHRGFDDRLGALELRMKEAEARAKGRADILKPVLEWSGKNWLALILAVALCWQTYVAPALQAFAPTQARASELRGTQ